MTGLEVIFYSIIALASGLMIVFTMWENVKLKDELNKTKETSIDLSRVPPELIPAAREMIFDHILKKQRESKNGHSND